MKNKFIMVLFLVSSIVHAEGLRVLDNKSGEILLESKSESCKFRMSSNNKIKDTDCVELRNSKDINIICTTKKTICKTLEEAKSFLEINVTPLDETDPRLVNLKDLHYFKARKIILGAGYIVKENKNPPEFGQAKELYALGYKEVDDCAGSAIMPCVFYFNAPNSKVLVVTTYTKESYGNIAIFISDWYLE